MEPLPTVSRRTAVADRPPMSRAARAQRVGRPGRPTLPAGSPKPRFRRSFRRLLALLALAFIGAALWAINATFQPFQGEDEEAGAVAVRIPEGSDARSIGRAARGEGRDQGRALLRGQRDGDVPARRPDHRQLRPAPQHDQRGGHRGAHAGPRGQGREDLRRDDPGGPVDPRVGEGHQRERHPRQLPQGGRERRGPRPGAQARAAQGRRHARGLPLPGDLHARGRRHGVGPGRQAARRVRARTSASSTSSARSARTSTSTTSSRSPR